MKSVTWNACAGGGANSCRTCGHNHNVCDVIDTANINSSLKVIQPRFSWNSK